jgi:hypothetical protein
LLVHDIPPHLRNTVDHLNLPIYIELAPEACIPPPRLALGDTLMVLGLIRNQGRPVRLCFDPGPARELIEAHPLVRELAPPEAGPAGLEVAQVPVARSGRPASWASRVTHRLDLPVLPVDRVRANPVLAHSLYYGLENTDDRPSLFLDPDRPPALAGLLSQNKPTLAVFPFNPGRSDHVWQDSEWWVRLARELRPEFALVGVGARDYGELGGELDQALSSNDPASTLGDLAWLFSRCAGFVGRDGGLYHLAAAVNSALTVVWDSLSSYRFWSGSAGHHLVMSNPYTYRYPQTLRPNLPQMVELAEALGRRGTVGLEAAAGLAAGAGREEVAARFGSVDAFGRAVMAALEADEDLRGAAWAQKPELRSRFYQHSLAFAAASARGRLPAGANWVAPVAP